FGSFFAPLTGVPPESFEVTRGKLSIFKSSDATERGFCNTCGTPLTFHYVGKPRISVSIGSLDEPERAVPTGQYGIEGRLSYFAILPTLPGDKTTEDDEPALAAAIRSANYQHPDHDTDAWPAGGEK
ncbi:MAG: GFA family protein, partial [Bauldia sp.]